MDTPATHVFFSPLGQLTQISALHYAGIRIIHVHEGHPLSSFAYPLGHELEQAGLAQGGRVARFLQLQVWQPYLFVSYPCGHAIFKKTRGVCKAIFSIGRKAV